MFEFHILANISFFANFERSKVHRSVVEYQVQSIQDELSRNTARS